MEYMNEEIKYIIQKLLKKNNIHPILLDIGASGDIPEIWTSIKEDSYYIGFDPDLRDLHTSNEDGFFKSVIFNSAVIEDINSVEVPFYLTKAPYCSSTLSPDNESLSNYIFYDLFTVEKIQSMKSSNLNHLMESQNITHIDWFKTDSQGIDLSLFKSLENEIRSKILAVDIEPGLIDAYVGEDLFADAHTYLIQNGFWLSELNVRGTGRIKKSTLDRLSSINTQNSSEILKKVIKNSPVWCEARYLRTIEWMDSNHFSHENYILSIIFALMDNQLGHAFDILFQYEKKNGDDEFSKEMLVTLENYLNDKIIQQKSIIQKNFIYKCIDYLKKRI